MNVNFDPILNLLGVDEKISYEDLTEEELKVYDMWADVREKAQVNLDVLREEVTQMRFAVSMELASLSSEAKFRSKNDRLKARLKNYLLLEERLTRPANVDKMLASYAKTSKNKVSSIG